MEETYTPTRKRGVLNTSETPPSHIPSAAAATAEMASHSYRGDIDGLRAIAVVAVVIFHAFPDLCPGGFVGVDIFFVISGYLISSILYKDLRQGDFKFRNFYSRRIKRIFPALILVFAFCLFLGWFVLFPTEFAVLGKHIVASAAFLENVALWRESRVLRFKL